jgi:lysophospholipase L1-like esterase
MNKTMNIRIFSRKASLASAIVLALSACAPEFDDSVKDITYKTGSADFSTYVAVGDSLTAGYADGALYLDGQRGSYPAMLGKAFRLTGGKVFTQPLVSDNNGGLLLGGNPIAETRLVLGLVDGKQAPKRLAATPTTDIAVAVDPMPNNMGVPGAKSYHLGAPGYGDISGVGATANPYFVRFASSPTATVIGDAATQKPSFFSLWVGNNDVLFYALSGGTGEDQTGNTPIDPDNGPDFSGYGADDITDPAAFALVYGSLVNTLKNAGGGKGVLITIPDVKSIPYFTTVPYNPLPLDQATADQLNAAYADYNNGLQQMVQNDTIKQKEADRRHIHFAAGNNAVVIEDEDLTDLTGFNLPSIRQATDKDLIMLKAGAKIGTLKDEADANSAWGIGAPLEDADVLVASERKAIETATQAYNTTIRNLADSDADLALMDANALMAQVSATGGLDFGSGRISAVFGTGGGFSLDGVHPTQRGYALIANAILASIEDTFGATLPRMEPMDYPTIFLDPNGP